MSKKAFLIGKSTRGLKFAEKDIALMKICLMSYDYEVIIPRQEKSSIIEAFDDFIDEVNQIDTILFYYSGHGHLEHGDLHLVLGNEIAKNRNTIEINYFIKRMERSSSNNKLIVLDCCNGLDFEKDWKPSQIGRLKILTASGHLESAKEIEELGASYFSSVFHETLLNPEEVVNNDGEIFIEKFYNHILKKAIKYNEDSNLKVPIPNLIGNHQSNFVIAHAGKNFLADNSVVRSSCSNDYVFTNLPDPDYDLFIGRDDELGILFKYLSPNFSRRSILIHGFGGIGKTSLAIEAARQCRNHGDTSTFQDIPVFDFIVYITFKKVYFKPDGVNQVLNGKSSLQDILRVMIEMYDISIINELSEGDKIDKIYQLLRKQRNLLIIDNLDALDESEQRRVISFVDHAPAPTKIILTSRGQISSPASIKIDPLNKDDSMKLIRSQIKLKQLEFANPEEIASQLYERFQGVPIALVCAVGQMALGKSVENVLDVCADSVGIDLEPEDLAFFCFGNSIKFLKQKPAHKLLMAIVIFSSSCSRNAIIKVSEVAANSTIIDNGFVILNKLSLITCESHRYNLPSILREYISSGAEWSEFEPKARISWVKWCIDYVKSYGGYDLQDWRYNYDKLELEWDNILSVLDWCKFRGRYDDIKKIWIDIDCYVDLEGRWDIRIAWWKYIKESAYTRRDKKMYVKALVNLGWTYTLLGSDDSRSAMKEYIEALKNIRNATQETIITLYKNIAVLRITQKKYSRALRWLEKSNRLINSYGSTQGMGERFSIINRYYVAEVHYKQELLDESLKLFKQVVECSNSYGWSRIANYSNNYLGLIQTRMGDLPSARLYLENGLIESKNSRESRRIALYQFSLALLEEQEENYEAVKKYTADALKVFRTTIMQDECDMAESLLQRISKYDQK
jgi:tetratricopeptide (TPR) repeat protein